MLDTALSANDRVELVAVAGKIEHSGTLDAVTLHGRAERGFTSRTVNETGATVAAANIDILDLELSAAGDITVHNAKNLTLAHVEAADGAITVTAQGTLTATQVATHGASDRNDITLGTSGIDSAVILGSVIAGGRGDVIITTQGSVSLAEEAEILVADTVSVLAGGAVSLLTSVNSIAVETTAAGAVTLVQDNGESPTPALTLSRVRVLDGSLTITAGGSIDLADVVLLSNKDANDIAVTATGDIKVRFVNAGFHAATAGEVPTPEGVGAEAGVTSHGDVFLTSTHGAITETFTDTAVDIVADRLELVAATGISGLETALNVLAKAHTAAGDITLFEEDGQGEKTMGLKVVSVQADKAGGNDVSIQSKNLLRVGETTDTAPSIIADVIRLTSTEGDIEVVRPTSGEALDYDSGVAFDANQILTLYRFFNAPELIEYRAGDRFNFALPNAITAKSVTLETGEVISITGTITASDLLELVLGTNVFISGNIVAGDGEIDSVVIKATGARQMQSAVDTNSSGSVTTTAQNSGYVNIQTTGIAASNFELRALRDIFVDLNSNLTLTGFIGGLSGFDPAANVSLNTAGTLTVTGGIVAANSTSGDLVLRAATVSTDKSSVFIAQDLDVEAPGAISLNTLVENIRAVSTGSGSIVINESDAVNLKEVIANNGKVEVKAGSTLNAHLVRTGVDGSGNDVVLATSGDLYVDYVEAGFAAGAQKQYATVTLDAAGTIYEMAPYDNAVVDVAGRTVTLKGTTAAPPVVVTGPDVSGSGADLEIFYTAAAGSGVITGATTMSGSGGIPSSVSGDYVLAALNRSPGPLTMNVTGILTVVKLPTYSGDTLSLSASDDMVIVSPLNVGRAPPSPFPPRTI